MNAVRAVARRAGHLRTRRSQHGCWATSRSPPASTSSPPFPTLTDARARHPRPARRWASHGGDRRAAVPVPQDREQPPDQHLRQARGRRPRGSHHPCTRRWPRAGAVMTPLAIILGSVALSLLAPALVLLHAGRARVAAAGMTLTSLVLLLGVGARRRRSRLGGRPCLGGGRVAARSARPGGVPAPLGGGLPSTS